MFFAEQRDDSIRKQKEENARRRAANAEEAAKEKTAVALQEASVPVHPSEGVLRE